MLPDSDIAGHAAKIEDVDHSIRVGLISIILFLSVNLAIWHEELFAVV